MINSLWFFEASCHHVIMSSCNHVIKSSNYQVTKSSDYHSIDFNVVIATDWLFQCIQGTQGQDCDPAISLDKTHSWNMGYIVKLTVTAMFNIAYRLFKQLLILIMIEYSTWHKALQVDQTWLSQQTEDWTLNITFCNNVTEFKVRTTPVRRQGGKVLPI